MADEKKPVPWTDRIPPPGHIFLLGIALAAIIRALFWAFADGANDVGDSQHRYPSVWIWITIFGLSIVATVAGIKAKKFAAEHAKKE